MDMDANKPNGGRIYDYMLGGSHNFEADRMAAERVLQLFPSMRNGMRMVRWFMHDAVERIAKSNFSCYLDLASGLPTQGYVHDLVPNAKVLYNDRDPVTVAYGREIIGDNPNVRYFQSDASDIDALLGAAGEFFGDERRIGVCFIGVSYFMTEEQVQKILDRLYEWCAPGSHMAISWVAGDKVSEELKQGMDLYAKMGSPLTLHSVSTIRRMLGSWKIMDPGLIPVTEWLQLEGWDEPGHFDSLILNPLGVIVAKP